MIIFNIPGFLVERLLCNFAGMKKQLIVGLVGLVYLVFCCAGLGLTLSAPQQEAVYFVHTDGHSDEYHASVPAKSAIKAFFAKKPVKANPSTFHPPIFFASIACSGISRAQIIPVNQFPGNSNADRFLLHCSFLL